MIPEHEHADLMQRLSVVETWIKELRDNHLPHIEDELIMIRERLSRSRPSWVVALLITALSSLSVGLIMKVVGQ